VDLSGKSGWPWLSAGGGGGGKKRKKKNLTPCRSQLGFRWWWKATAKKNFPRRADPAGGFRWWWKEKKKKKKSHAVPIPAGFQVVVESHGQKKFPTPCRPSWWFQVVVERKEKKKEIPRRRADPMVSGGGRLRKENKVLMKVVINCEKRK
jgi:hypothetical protein